MRNAVARLRILDRLEQPSIGEAFGYARHEFVP